MNHLQEESSNQTDSTDESTLDTSSAVGRNESWSSSWVWVGAVTTGSWLSSDSWQAGSTSGASSWGDVRGSWTDTVWVVSQAVGELSRAERLVGLRSDTACVGGSLALGDTGITGWGWDGGSAAGGSC